VVVVNVDVVGSVHAPGVDAVLADARVRRTRLQSLANPYQTHRLARYKRRPSRDGPRVYPLAIWDENHAAGYIEYWYYEMHA
jgi:hypothetical protein